MSASKYHFGAMNVGDEKLIPWIDDPVTPGRPSNAQPALNSMRMYMKRTGTQFYWQGRAYGLWIKRVR